MPLAQPKTSPPRTSPGPFAFATFATLIAGFVDAVGYAHLGGLFLSFMSGNSTRLGIALGEEQWTGALHAATVIASFVLGAFLGTLLSLVAGSWKLVLILFVEVALFALATSLVAMDAGFAALLPVSIAMGLQNSVHQVIGGADIGKSFVTGALFGMGQALAKCLTGTAKHTEWLAYAASWGSFVVGALIGALALGHFGLTNTMGAACALLLVLAIIALFAHHRLARPVAIQS